MLIAMRPDADPHHQTAVVGQAQAMGLAARPIARSQNSTEPLKVAVGALRLNPDAAAALNRMPMVAAVHDAVSATPLCSRVDDEPTSKVRIGDVDVGGSSIVMMAGPCAVESFEQLLACAQGARQAGARILRGGAYKPRSSPYAFMGLEERALEYFTRVRAATGLAVVTEVMAVADIPRVAAVADGLQVGARNMQNFPLLRALGQQPKPVLLKRGLSATYEEWLMAAEYILVHGNSHVILCERGIRTFESHTRNTLDLAAVPVVRARSHLPIVVDPSHGTGVRRYVPALARAAVAAGADGVMLEAHPDPDTALSDGPQSLTLPMLLDTGRSLAPLAQAVGRDYAVAPKEGSP